MSNTKPEFHEVSINLNGLLRIKKQPDLSNEDAEALALNAIQALLSKPFSSPNNDITGSLVKADVWASSGSVKVGNLFFDVLHDIESQTSCVVLDIKPVEGEFGHRRVRSEIKSYITPNSATISAIDSTTNNEKPLVTVGFQDGDLSVFLHKDDQILNDNSEGYSKVDMVSPVSNCVTYLS